MVYLTTIVEDKLIVINIIILKVKDTDSTKNNSNNNNTNINANVNVFNQTKSQWTMDSVKSSEKKDKDEEESKVDKKPNLSNIHDFFRHVFIRKNSTNVGGGSSQYLPTPGTIGMFF